MHLPGAYLGEMAMVADGGRTFLIWQVEELGLLADRDDQGVLLQVNPLSHRSFIESFERPLLHARRCTCAPEPRHDTPPGEGTQISNFPRDRAA